MNLSSLTEMDRLIHEPARLVIMTILHTAEQVDFLFLQRESGLTKGNLSFHLAKLEEGGYILIEKTYRGRVPLTLIALSEKGRQAFETYRQQLAQLMQKMKSED